MRRDEVEAMGDHKAEEDTAYDSLLVSRIEVRNTGT